MRIIIEVSGGVVQSVYADDTDISIAVLDHDDNESGDGDETTWALEDEIKTLNEVY